MIIGGLQKLTLLDFPGTVACTVFTVGCNLRCPFCHNPALVNNPPADMRISEDEFFAFLRKRQGILDGVAITGGEPLLHADIGEFIAKIKSMGFKVKLDTNGTFPDRLEKILAEGNVDYVAMDIKNTFDRYAETVGIRDFDVSLIQRSIRLIQDSGIAHEFRTTVVSPLHTADNIGLIAKQVEGSENYFLQNFVDSGDLLNGEGLSELPREELERALENAKKIIPQTKIRGES
ncbi:MAG: anaerobic ribonucleoside-triphosphate reductase activating protein [Lachnospiraceae bacterium]|nr:anaerobic ribonucleoside-triphosphate reductase activating protein [Lachnospiraceae bacterium]